MAVNTDENKQLLLQLLHEHPLKRNNPNDFMHVFNTINADIHKARFKYNNDLIAMNKEILRHFQSMIPIQPKWERKEARSTSETDEPVPKLKIFEMRLKEQQDNFNNMIKAEIPDEIDFSDNVKDDVTITSNTIDETMQKRQQELRKIMVGYQKDKKAEAWIKGENIKPESSSTNQSSVTAPELSSVTASELSSVNATELSSVSRQELPSIIKNKDTTPSNKQVSFKNISENNSSGLLHKLKIKPNVTQEEMRYTDYLKEIINNQKLILVELKQLNSRN